ncbi:hypothetical protein PFISCL1PPCAC_2779, partial [Pristionchus fissidentatus]
MSAIMSAGLKFFGWLRDIKYPKSHGACQLVQSRTCVNFYSSVSKCAEKSNFSNFLLLVLLLQSTR